MRPRESLRIEDMCIVKVSTSVAASEYHYQGRFDERRSVVTAWIWWTTLLQSRIEGDNREITRKMVNKGLLSFDLPFSNHPHAPQGNSVPLQASFVETNPVHASH